MKREKIFVGKRLRMAVCTILAVFMVGTTTALGADITITEFISTEYRSIDRFKEGFAIVKKGDSKSANGKYRGDPIYGFIDKTGREIVPCIYTNADRFSEGFAGVNVGGNRYGVGGKWGFIDTTGKEVVPCQYDRVNAFSEGLAVVNRDGKWGFINTAGNEIVSCKYDVAYSFSEGIAAVGINTGETDSANEPIRKWSLIDKTGKEIASLDEQIQVIGAFSNGLAPVYTGSGCGFINKTGELAFPYKYAYRLFMYTSPHIKEFSEGFARVEKDLGQNGFIDVTGREIAPCKYETASDFSEGLAAVSLNGKSGFIDGTGKEIIPCKFEGADSFSEGLAAVAVGGKYGYIDKTGKEIVPCIYDRAHPFSGGFAVVEQKIENSVNSEYGIIDKTGREVIPFGVYDLISGMSDGIAIVSKGIVEDGFVSLVTNVPGFTAYRSTQSVMVDGRPINFQMYALRDASGNPTNYVKLRDVASVLNSTAAQFEVSWDGVVNIVPGRPYTPNGSEMTTPFSGDRTYTVAAAPTRINGKEISIDAIVLEDDQGGAYTYYKLRDLGEAIGFRVDWSAEKGISVQTK